MVILSRLEKASAITAPASQLKKQEVKMKKLIIAVASALGFAFLANAAEATASIGSSFSAEGLGVGTTLNINADDNGSPDYDKYWTAAEGATIDSVITAYDEEKEITGCYCGDLLSWVMSRAKEGDAWLTVMGNVNAVAVAVLMASLIIIIGVLYPYFGGVQESQLKDELSLAAEATQQLGEGYLENLDSDRYRLTWVAHDGTVIFDSHVDANTMEKFHGSAKEEVTE